MNTNQPTNPPDADVILERFKRRLPQSPSTTPEPTGLQPALEPPSWLKTKRLLKREREDSKPGAAEAVDQALHQLHVRLEVQEHRIAGLEEALGANKKRRKKQRVLPLQPIDGNGAGGAVLWRPSRIERAKEEVKAREQQELAAEAAKVTKRELQHQKKLLKAKEQEERRVERERQREVAAQAQAAKRAAIEARKEARAAQQRDRNAEKSTQLPNQAKSKASQQSRLKTTKRRGGAAARSRVVPHVRSPTPPLRFSSTKRKIYPTRKFR
ncbi:hypothetical protein E8E12_000519 [Didymella heteroderae]|uniref:Uncharacterized protein n=1 Tax=Didymella heteroderae TaxID=1769908 RepID=A0A9P4WG58_9PLEO|nr:hypothetical protein E8E12_000519 [Didymella heteroderae]